jgi:hypothetical protein
LAKSTSALLTRRSPADITTLPPSVEQHPSYRQFNEQRQTLSVQLAAAPGELARLTEERDQLHAIRQEV